MICVSIQEKNFARCKKIVSGCGMAEIRGDLCNFTTAQTEELVSSHPNLLYTHRIAGSSLEKAYTQMTAAIKKGVKYVDVEIEAPVDYLEMIKSFARVNGCSLVISYHNFEGTQSLEELQTIYDICRRKGADIVKIVTTAHSISDANRVMQLYNYRKSDKDLVPDNYMQRGEESGSLSNGFGEEQASLVAFCMGEAGKFTRHLCLELGAPYTYVALDAENCTAPGQYTKEEMEKLMDAGNYKFTTPKASETIFASEFPEIGIPCSKSIAQRAILAAALAEGTTVLENFEPCNDILGAIEVVKALGTEVSIEGTALTIKSGGVASLKNISEVFVGESGLLTRLLIPMATMLSAGGNEIAITGHGSILKRNLQESANAVEAAGATCTTTGNGYLPFSVSGGIKRTEIEFSGKESSQIVSGFLMTLPLMQEDSTLTVTNPTSLPYIELTLKVMKAFGVEVAQESSLPEKIIYKLSGRQKYTPTRMYMDSDWSSAANFAVAGALTGGVVLKNMPLEAAQADEFVLTLLEKLGYGVEKTANGELYDIRISPATKEPVQREFSLTHCPDLFPMAVVLACNTPGEVVFTGVERLAQKESNRAETIYRELAKLGYNIRIEGDKMYLCGKRVRKGTAPVLGCGHNDHRIAMALYIASLAQEYPVLVDEIKCIDKSFPSFVGRLKR